MKKIILFFALSVITLTGCTPTTPEQIDTEVVKYIHEFNYKGHHYLLYDDGVGDIRTTGLVHDPDCSCHNKLDNIND